MKTKNRKMIILAVVCTLFVVGLVLINGCKKSQPSTATTETSSNDMANMSNNEVMTANAKVEAMPNGQKICPVMGQPVDPNVFVEYQGKKVYFCCDDCKADFLKNPEKYIAKLPQFEK